MGSSGIIWAHLGSSGIIWIPLRWFGSIWDHLGSSWDLGITWDYLGSSELIWKHLGSSGIISEIFWGHVGLSGVTWNHLEGLWEGLGEVSGGPLGSLWGLQQRLWQLWALSRLLRSAKPGATHKSMLLQYKMARTITAEDCLGNLNKLKQEMSHVFSRKVCQGRPAHILRGRRDNDVKGAVAGVP